MKNILSLFFFTFLTFLGNAQVWIDSGAVWHYQSSAIFGYKSYAKQTYEKDTLINGQLCQKIIGESHSFIEDTPPNIYYAYSVTHKDPAYTYVNGDTVFYLADDGFRVLCNFGAQVGDSWVAMTHVIDSANVDSLVVSVVEVGNISINNQSYRYMDLAADTCQNFGFGGRFVERFGFYHTHNYTGLSQFPYWNDCNSILETFGSNLFCFNDQSFQLNGYAGEACEFPDMEILGNENVIEIAYAVFPNPVDEFFVITGVDIESNSLKIFDITGAIIIELQDVMNNQQIDVSDLKPGIYLVNVYSTENSFTKKIIIQ